MFIEFNTALRSTQVKRGLQKCKEYYVVSLWNVVNSKLIEGKSLLTLILLRRVAFWTPNVRNEHSVTPFMSIFKIVFLVRLFTGCTPLGIEVVTSDFNSKLYHRINFNMQRDPMRKGKNKNFRFFFIILALHSNWIPYGISLLFN